jgi:2-polyprenyl-3-methyl-5-hydroxy-6-metoxy-1,4-benzoquinol methylase
VTALRRCDRCQLLFRTPTTSADAGLAFYQEQYSQGLATDCPSDEQLTRMIANEFKNTEADYSTYIDVICAAGGLKGSSLFDFGCSWGYGSWQFMHRGFNVESLEVSIPRANYARRKLGIKVHASIAEVKETFDIFFSAHVLEHVPSAIEAITFGMSILRPAGLFVAFTPNGSAQFRQKDEKTWTQLWGMVHPNFLDDRYYKNTFAGKPILISSNPYQLDEVKLWSNGGSPSLPIDGGELLLLARK